VGLIPGPRRAFTGRARVRQARVVQQSTNRRVPPGTVAGIEIGAARDHEPRLWRGAEGPVEKSEPEGDFVVVAPPVAVLGPVEHRRSGLEGQQRHHPARRVDRHHPMACGEQPLLRERLRRGER